MIEILYIFTVIYAISVLIVFIYQYKMLNSLKGRDDPHKIISILWAWSSEDELIKYDNNLMNNQPLMKNDKIPHLHLFNPLILFSLIILIMYQVQSKSKKNSSQRVCVFSPSCSNYAIGMLRRYSFFYSYKKIQIRLRRCDGRKNSIDFN
ncbi:MAG: membrane protein insertion efficiency factor YidD [Sulfurovum sp.]|nr:membrane protein insertion efficiency factor YidD [Sulfurovum sp.]